MKYLVMRKEIIKGPHIGASLQSSCFPIEVEVLGGISDESIVRMALDKINPGYIGMYDYVVVPMDRATVVSFRKPQPQYEVHVDTY